MNKEFYPSSEKVKPNYTARRLGAIAILSLSIFIGSKGIGVVGEALDHMAHPYVFSEETESYIEQPGEGLYNAVEHINNIGSIPADAALSYVENMPQNKKALSNGIQAWESIEIPKSVTKR